MQDLHKQCSDHQHLHASRKELYKHKRRQRNVVHQHNHPGPETIRKITIRQASQNHAHVRHHRQPDLPPRGYRPLAIRQLLTKTLVELWESEEGGDEQQVVRLHDGRHGHDEGPEDGAVVVAQGVTNGERRVNTLGFFRGEAGGGAGV